MPRNLANAILSLATIFALLSAGLLFPMTLWAVPADPATQCQALHGTTIGGATVEAARMQRNQIVSRDYCVVTARVGNSGLRITVRLPASDWNDKLVFLGGGGFHGTMWGEQLLSPFSDSIFGEPYVVAVSNGGYDARPDMSGYYDAAFADDPKVLDDVTHLAVHRSLPAVKAIIAGFYGRPAIRSYFEGLSMGGQQALIEAQRYPDDFDGIVARAPAANAIGLFLKFHQISQAFADPSARLSKAQRKLLAAEVLGACDGADGLDDGLIANPGQCRFDPAVLLCNAPNARKLCLAEPQVAAVRTVVSRLTALGGRISHPGFAWGGEDSASGWDEFIFPRPGTDRSLQEMFSSGFIRSIVAQDRGFDAARFRAEDWRPRLEKLAGDWQATNPDLAAFRARKGKLIIWTGGMDSAVSPRDIASYYDAVAGRMGQRAADETVELFMAPGVGHGGGSDAPGAGKVDLLKALAQWVEAGTAPSRQGLVAFRRDAMGGTLERPLCKYPLYPRYVGGPVTEARSFQCTQ